MINLDSANAHNYIKTIKQRYIKLNELPFIDDIVIYTHGKIVYKVLVRYCERLKSKLKRLFKKNGKNYTSHIVFLTDIPRTKINDDIVVSARQENILLIYNNHNNLISVIEGDNKDYELFTNSLTQSTK